MQTIRPTKVLENTYSRLVTSPKLFLDWVNKMANGDVDSKRILFSIAIDTHFQLCDISNYVNLFDSLDYSSKTNKPHFIVEEAIKLNPKLHFYSNDSYTSKVEPYVRVLSIDVFIKYYLNKSGFEKQFMNDDKNLLRKKNQQKYRFINVKENKGGLPRELVFVSTQREIDRVKGLHQNIAYIVNEDFGLLHNSLEEIVYLIYPINFNEETYQPITINSTISKKNNVYLSYKNYDGFGRTRSSYKDKGIDGVKERVHKPVNKVYRYEWKYLGKVGKVRRNVTNIINEASIRLNS